MNASNSILVISRDVQLESTLKANDKSNNVFFVHPDADEALLSNIRQTQYCSTIILDLGVSAEQSIDDRRSQIVRIKEVDPCLAIILIGEQGELSQLLDQNTQSLVFRAFTKPIKASQIALSFSAATAHYHTLSTKLSTGELAPSKSAQGSAAIEGNAPTGSKSKPLILVALAVIALGIFSWFIFLAGSDPSPNNEPTADVVKTELNSEVVSHSIAVSATQQRIIDLNNAGQQALTEGRLITPEHHNAQYYFDQVLAIDAYDATAYLGKKRVASRLRDSIDSLIEKNKFDESFTVLAALQQLEPLETNNDRLSTTLQNKIDQYVLHIRQNGSPQEIANTTAMLGKLESRFTGSKNASDALKRESALVTQIDSALKKDLLAPPIKNNAYSLVSSALKNNLISNRNLKPRINQLRARLITAVHTSVREARLEDAQKLFALIKKLNPTTQEVAALEKYISQTKDTRQKKVISKQAATQRLRSKHAVNVSKENTQLKIQPVIPLSRPAPKYPLNARERGIEGTVEITFRVDTSGNTYDVVLTDSKPSKTFDKAALRVVKRWKFTPAWNTETNKAVDSGLISTKIKFTLNP